MDKNAARLYATIYVDQNADSAQRDALTTILQFLNGAYETSPLQAAQVKAVPVVFTESTDRTTYTLDIPGILEERASLRRDALGKPLSNVTAMDDWSNTEHYADNELFTSHEENVRPERNARPVWRFLRSLDPGTACNHPQAEPQRIATLLEEHND